ncbi:MAG: tail fiber domain-containing protein [Gammaproteobacteria bacterium]
MTTSSFARVGVLLCGLVLFALPAQAQIPAGLNYQGYLSDAAGQPIDEPVNVTFSMYAVPAGGSPLWTETMSLVPTQGLFATELGVGLSPFPTGLFSTPVWVGITVGNDAEMTPRRGLTTVPYARRAADADTLGGLPSAALNQAADVSTLFGNISNLSSQISGVQVGVNGNASDIGNIGTDIAGIEQDVSALQSDVNTAEADINSIEATLPGLQNRVNGSCASGSSIRQVLANGNVTCETDDAGPWLFDGDAYLTGTRVGLNTSAPAASLQIDAPIDEDPFRARVQSSTKLRVHSSNGSVSVGTSAAGPTDGLFVSGSAGIGTSSPNARLAASDINWQFALANTDAGGGSWYLGSSANAWAAGGGKLVINSTNNSNGAAFVIDSNKDVGIGTTDPLGRLHVGSGTDVTPGGGGYIIAGSATSSNIAWDNNEIMARSNGSVSTLSLNAEGGEVRINSGGTRDSDAFEVRGRAYFDNGGNSGMRFTATTSSPTNALLEPTLFEEGLVGGSARPFWRMYSREFYAQSPIEYRTYSDRSLKQNVAAIPNALDIVQALEGVTYELNKHPMDDRERTLSAEEEYDRTHQLGFIAQDVEKILPQLVKTDEFTGLESVGYMAVIPVLVEAIKDQQRQIEELKAEVVSLR